MDNPVKATVTAPAERTVELSLPESQARRLMFVLMNDIDWAGCRFPKTPQWVWEALEAAGVEEGA